ncbi:MAG: tetraacyldisaccharide 4'-kinase [Pseudomonadaceae bacterium]
MSGQSLEQRLLRAWYGKATWLRLLRPLSALYCEVADRRRRAYLDGERTQWQPPVPLIVVGNITVGGTGKTPMVVWLIAFLRAQGYRVGVISRGYGAKPPSFPWMVSASDDPAVCGDEPSLLVRRCGVPLVIDPDRPAAAQHLLRTADVDLIISDDGLQHYALGRTVELVMLDHERGLGNARCLPEGPLREPAERLDAVDLVVRNGAAADSPDGFAMQLLPQTLINLVSGERIAAESWPGSRQVTAMAGIGNPQRFFRTLETLAFKFDTRIFPDHAHYDASILESLPVDRPVLMTEKDAVKCAPLAQDNWWYLSVEAHLSETFETALLELLASSRPEKIDQE